MSPPVHWYQPTTDIVKTDSKATIPDWLNPKTIIVFVGIVVAFLFVGYLGYLFFDTHEVPAVVQSHQWSRSIEVEEYRTVTESDWNIPSGGRRVSSQQKIHHYDDVLDHYETRTRNVCENVRVGSHEDCEYYDRGNGSFDQVCRDIPEYENQCHSEEYREPIYRQEPVYQTWYTYEIDKWVFDHKEIASGQDKDPYWPNVVLMNNQRKGSKSQSYIINTSSEEGSKSANIGFDLWNDLEIGDEVILHVNHFGIVLNVDKVE